MRKKPVFVEQEVNDKKVIIYYQAKPVSFFSYNCYRLDKKSLKDRIREKNLGTEKPKNRNRRKMLSKKINEFFAASSSSGIQNEIKN